MPSIKKLLQPSLEYTIKHKRLVFIKNYQDFNAQISPKKSHKRNIRLQPKIYDYTYILINSFLTTIKKFARLVNRQPQPIKILDLGCGKKPFQPLFPKSQFVGVDISFNSQADVIADNHHLPFKDNAFDAVIASEVLEHSSNEYQFVKEVRRVAKNNALVFVSLPFIFPLHGVPYDFQRFTKYKLFQLFQSDKIVYFKPSNNLFSSFFCFANLILRTLFGSLKLVAPLYAFNNLLALAAESINHFYRHKKGFVGQYWEYALTALPIGYSFIVKIKK